MENLRASSDEFGWRYVAAGTAVVVALLLLSQTLSGGTGGHGEEMLEVNLTVDYGVNVSTQVIEVANGSTAFDALNHTAEVEFQESSYGYFITGVNDVSQNATHSWIYLVNGEAPKKAANRFRLENRDRILYLYLHNNKTGKYFE
ncbi:MAG: DUF4430 domain-containing protein [Candidatus Nanohaloarchaea archaeon]